MTEDVTFRDGSTFSMPDPDMYGIEQVLIMKHIWMPGHDVVRGALVHDQSTGHQYFVLERDLARYQQKPEPLDPSI